MSELEKAKNNLFNDIDHGKLVVELREDIERHQDYIDSLTKKGFFYFVKEMTPRDVVYEAEMFLYTINAILNCLPLQMRVLPLYVGALDTISKLLSGKLDKEHKAHAAKICRMLSEEFIAVSEVRERNDQGPF